MFPVEKAISLPWQDANQLPGASPTKTGMVDIPAILLVW
jgi:hypothetical protein